MSDLDDVKALLKWNPAVLQAKAIKVLAVFGIITALCLGSYFMGRHDGKQGALNALKTVAAKVADQRADNAIGAAGRLGQYNIADRELEVGITDAMQQVQDYYAAHQPAPIVVERQKLVPVPGKQELVYVPSNLCPSTFLDADELRLYNLGNKRSDLNAGDSR